MDLDLLCMFRNIELYWFQVPGLIRPEFVKPGAIVIDVGINRIMVEGKAKIVGDVDPKVSLLYLFRNIFNDFWAVHPILVTWFLVVKLPKYYVIVCLLFLLRKARQARQTKRKSKVKKITQPKWWKNQKWSYQNLL